MTEEMFVEYRTWYASYKPDGGLWTQTRDVDELFEEAEGYDGPGELTFTEYRQRIVTYLPWTRRIARPPVS